MVVFLFGAWRIGQQWQGVAGAEYHWVANGLRLGHGFSVRTAERWLYPENYGRLPEAYNPTAWVEPAYPFVIAIFFRAFGEPGKLPLALLQYAALIGACALLYPLGKRSVGAGAGMCGGLLLALSPDARWQAENFLSPAPIGTLVVTASVLAIYRCRERPTLRRGIELGLLLGLGCLTLVPLLLFVPVSLVVLLASRPRDSRAAKAAIAMLLVSVVVITPWTFRNYVVFHRWIPLRTGAGLNAFLGNPALAATFREDVPQACSGELGPMWKAAGPAQAIALAMSDEALREAMFDRAYACIRLRATADYDTFNEAERDHEYLRAAVEFIVAEPLLFARLVAHRWVAFFSLPRSAIQEPRAIPDRSPLGLAVSLLALIGALSAMRLPTTRPLPLLALAYSAPYLLMMPWFYRYRLPIEPILLVLVAHGGMRYLRLFDRRRHDPQ